MQFNAEFPRQVMNFPIKSVRASIIYRILDKLSVVNNLEFLPIQNVRQYQFPDVEQYDRISLKESTNIKVKSSRQNEEYNCLSLDEMLPW